MAIHTLKNTLHQLIEKIEDEALLKAYLKVLESSIQVQGKDWWDEISAEVDIPGKVGSSSYLVNYPELKRTIFLNN